MWRRAGLGAILVLAAGAAVLAESPAVPDSPAGQAVEAYLHAFNAPEEEALRSYLEDNLAPEAVARMPLAQRMPILRRIRGDLGTLEPVRVVETAGGVEVIARGSTGAWAELSLRFDPDPPGRLLGVQFRRLPGPPDLEASAEPLAESELPHELETLFDGLAARDEFSGAVLVARGDETLFEGAWGLASKEYGVANRVDTRFNLGSINKLFTRIAVEQLAEAGALSLSDTIGVHLPHYPNREAAAKVTVAQLLDMSSGIGDFFGEQYQATPKDRIRDLEDYLPLFASEPLLFEPGTGNRYSNGGYVVLGLIIEKVSGQSYYDAIRERIYAPAGMTASGHLEADRPTENVASGYTRLWDGEEHPGEARRNNIYTRPCRGSSAGGGYSTVHDLLRFVRALEAGELGAAVATRELTTGDLGVAGGAPGINAALETRGEYTVIVLSNYDPPAAMSAARRVTDLLRRVRNEASGPQHPTPPLRAGATRCQAEQSEQ